MVKTISYTLLLLLLLTTIAALVSNFIDLKIGVFLILMLSAVKFGLVAFSFMELKKAHTFWKAMTLAFLVIFIVIIMVLLA